MILKDRMRRASPIWRRIVDRAFGPENKGFVMAQGAIGAAAGNIAVSKIKKNDHLVAVFVIDIANGAADLTAEFKLISDGIINNAGGTATTGNVLVVLWEAFDG